MVRALKIVVPCLLLGAAGFGAWKLIDTRPEVRTETRGKVVPLVRAIPVQRENVRLTVTSQGTVTPRTVSDLVPEVAGRVIFASPSLAAGGFFEKDDVLLRIDPYDYQLAVIRSEAEVAQARLRLEQERAEAEVAAREWQELEKNEEPSDLVLRRPQVAQAEAALEAAKAVLEQSRRDLERTEVRAPFAGRVRQENVDIGQYVGRGIAVAQLYAVDFAEVRLPLPDEELAFVKIPLSYRGDSSNAPSGPMALLKASFAGQEYSWKARIVRTEGQIDTATRMLYAVAQVPNPYGRGGRTSQPPLAVGMFVEAEIQGNWLPNVVVLPRSAIRGLDTVYVIDDSGRLHFRKVEIYRSENDRVILSSGLENGELVCISPLETVVDGMNVRLNFEETPS